MTENGIPRTIMNELTVSCVKRINITDHYDRANILLFKEQATTVLAHKVSHAFISPFYSCNFKKRKVYIRTKELANSCRSSAEAFK
jgi:hypothetical protein